MTKVSDCIENNINIFDPVQGSGSDLLGRIQIAKTILNRISEMDYPRTIGLYGGWGIGKTSILNLMNAINEEKKIPLIEKPLITYLDVWPYEVSGNLALPIIIQIRSLFGGIPPAEYSKSWRKITGVLFQAGTDILLRRTLDLELSDVKGYVDNLKDVSPDQVNIRDFETLVDNIRGARNSFVDMVRLARQANHDRRLVFLIDNLDRCSPDNVVQLLESIKNFLDVPNCVWVFAMDSGVIASYIDHKYAGTSMDGNSYLDKIIPEQYQIPPVSGKDLQILERFLSKAKPSIRGGLPSIDLSKIPQIPEVLVPRRLLKTAHKFYKIHSMDSDVSSPASPDLIFSLILLYNSWPAFYERFSSEESSHVAGILVNFLPEKERNFDLVPIPQKYSEDRSLTHYMTHCFIRNQDLSAIPLTLAASMAWLRRVGLP
jgi:hypothetical protein